MSKTVPTSKDWTDLYRVIQACRNRYILKYGKIGTGEIRWREK